MIRDWKLRVNITGDCFINQCWTGTVEIHQFVAGGNEAVQTLNLQDYVLEDVKLQYLYDGDLLIPLQKGDYVIYYPNEYYTEMPIRSGDKVTVGMIFYYVDDLDLSDYSLNVHFHRVFSQGWSFIIFVVTASLLVLSLAMYISSVLTYRSAQKQIALRRSSLSYMSELYEAIYIINLKTDEITSVSPGEYVETLRVKTSSARELLFTAVRNDAEETYRDMATAFVNTDSLADRMEGQDSIVCEFASKEHGWCRIRFFAMDRIEGKPLENVIFAVQDINDERSEVKSLTDRLEKAETTAAANNAFLSDAARDLQEPVRELLSLDEQLLREKDPEKIWKYAESIQCTADRMLTLISGLADRAALEAGQKKAVSERYSLKQILREAFHAVQPLAEKKQIQLLPDVSESLPDALIGDAGKLTEATVSLLANVLNHSTDGRVLLSVFGKIREESVHLLFSVRAVPENSVLSGVFPDQKPNRAVPDLDLEVAGSLLSGLGSRLKSVRSPDDWKDQYYEIDQRIADPAPVGVISAEDLKA